MDSQLQHLRVLKEEVEASWNAAASTWNSQALTRLYTHDAVFFGLLPEFYVGRSQIEKYFSDYDNTLRGVTLELVGQELRMVCSGAFVAQGFGNLMNYRIDGELFRNRVRTSLVIVKIEDEWQISLHHFSNIPHSGLPPQRRG